jgi:molybdopterin synthase sulfur carrier subunit
MSIKVRYFASLKEKAGRSEDVLEPVENLTVREVWRLCLPNKPSPENTLVAINMNYAEWDSFVQDGDEVAFFPPVTGGAR